MSSSKNFLIGMSQRNIEVFVLKISTGIVYFNFMKCKNHPHLAISLNDDKSDKTEIFLNIMALINLKKRKALETIVIMLFCQPQSKLYKISSFCYGHVFRIKIVVMNTKIEKTSSSFKENFS